MTYLTQLIAKVNALATLVGDTLQLRGFKAGGSAGQVPVKNSGADYDWSWGDVEGGGGGSGGLAEITTSGFTAGHILRVKTGGGVEGRTPAQTLSDIGAVAATGGTATNLTISGTTSFGIGAAALLRSALGLPDMTDVDVTAGTSTDRGIPTPAQLKLAAQTHGDPGKQVAYCTSDLIRNNTAILADDPVMILPLDAASTYEISAWVEMSCDATPLLKFRIFFSAALDSVNGNSYGEISLNGGVFGSYVITSAGVGQEYARTVASTRYVWKIRAAIRTLAGCNVSLQWAQSVSDAGNTTRCAGSYLKAVKVARASA